MSKVAVLSQDIFQRQQLQLLGGIRTAVSQLSGADGLPDASAIHAARESKLQKKIDGDTAKMTKSGAVVAAFDELRSKVHDLEEAAKKLVNPGGNTAIDVFQMKTANITTTEVPKIDCVEVIAENSAALGQYNVVVNRLAAADTKTIFQRLDSVNGYIGFASKTIDVVTGNPGFFTAATFDINSAANGNITLVGGDTLETIAGKINAATATTGVSASITHGNNGYLLKLTSTKTGVANAFTIQDNGALQWLKTESIGNTPEIVRHVDIAPAVGFGARGTSVVKVNMANTFRSGVFSINGTNITLNDNQTLDQVADTINTQTATTGVKASITGTVATGFHLVLDLVGTSYDQIKILQVGITDVFTNLPPRRNTAAQDASIAIDGVESTRSENAISDAIPGVTFTLKQPNTFGKSETVRITEDKQKIFDEGINGFIEAYDALSLFTTQQTERDSKYQFKDTAVLGHKLPSSMVHFLQDIERQVSGLPDGSSSLLDIGIKRKLMPADTAQNIPEYYCLAVDQSKFAKAIKQNFDLFRQIFTTNLSGVSSDKLRVLNSTAATTLSSFNLTVNPGNNTAIITPSGGGGAIQCTYTGNATSGTIKGIAGTVTEGLELVYTSSNSGPQETINNITFTRGVASRMYDQLIPYDDKDGILARSQAIFQTAKDQYTKKVEQDQKDYDKLLQKHQEENAKIDAIRMQLQMSAEFLAMMSGRDK